MPASGAHFVFGQQAVQHLDSDIKRVIEGQKAEFNLGLQGPDIFFYYPPGFVPWKSSSISHFGSQIHSDKAEAFFLPIIKEKGLGNASLSYLFGLVCHYSLDSFCHPYVYLKSKDESHHFYLESCFDVFIMKKYGYYTDNRSSFIDRNGLDLDAVTGIWKTISPKDIDLSIRCMRYALGLLNNRDIVAAGEYVAGRKGVLSSMCLPKRMPEYMKKHMNVLSRYFMEALDFCTQLMESVYIKDMENCRKMMSLNYRGE